MLKIEAKSLVVTAALVFLGSITVAATTYYVLTKNFEKERAVFEQELRTTNTIRKPATTTSTNQN
jgi:hypothetical protein